MSKADLVHMVRDPKEFPDSNRAQVEPQDVETFRALGFEVADPLDHDQDGKKGGSLPDDDDGEGLTKVEIIADLEALQIEFDPRAKKADLLALRNERRAKRDAEKAGA